MTTRKVTLARVLMFLPLAIGPAANISRAEPLPSIFSGQDLAGWRVPENNVWWHARDGVLKVTSGPQQNESTLWTEKEYRNFIMEFEFKFGEGTVDSGIFVRTDREQIQIGISGSLNRDMTGSPYIAGKGYPVEAKGVSELLKANDWNAMTIVAKGKNYTVWLNGRNVMSYDSDSAVERGPIGIQLHGSRTMSIDYRKLTLAELE
jgi:hypothetical protein